MKKLLFTLTLALAALMATAQSPVENRAFDRGEALAYKLYFNWKFVWVDVGTATMSIGGTYYDGQPAYRAHLVTRTNGWADKLFVMRDTLKATVTSDLVPRYYRKGAFEGSQYRVDEVWYTYDEQKRTHIRQRYQNPYGEVRNTSHVDTEPIYDMLTMMLRARSFDGSKYKKGDRIHFLMADGDEVDRQVLVCRGRDDFKMENTGTRYHCIVFSFVEKDKDGKERDIITFYVTDDDNHLPVRLDMNLRFGTAKAFLTAASGVRNPQTSRF